MRNSTFAPFHRAARADGYAELCRRLGTGLAWAGQSRAGSALLVSPNPWVRGWPGREIKRGSDVSSLALAHRSGCRA